MIAWTYTIMHFGPSALPSGKNLVEMVVRDSKRSIAVLWWFGFTESWWSSLQTTLWHQTTFRDTCNSFWLTIKMDRKFYCPIKLSAHFSALRIRSSYAYVLEDMTQSWLKIVEKVETECRTSTPFGPGGPFCLQEYICHRYSCLNIWILFIKRFLSSTL